MRVPLHAAMLGGTVALLFVLAAAPAGEPPPVTLSQIISLEHPSFDNASAGLKVGRDGLIYLSSCGSSGSYIMRIARDGSGKYGLPVVMGAGHSAVANADGIIGVAHSHLTKQFALYDRMLKHIGGCGDFLANDQVGWNAPGYVDVDASGDFYVLDPNADRILRIGANGKVLKAYSIPHEPAGREGWIKSFRVCEAKEMFVLQTDDNGMFLRGVGFDGKTRWSRNTWHISRTGCYDIDDNGNVYLLDHKTSKMQKFTADGKPVDDFKFEIAPASFFCVFGQDLIVRRSVSSDPGTPVIDPTVLFEVYDLATNKLKSTVKTDFEQLTATYPSTVWTAGQPVPFKVEFASKKTLAPRWRLWVRPLEVTDYRELKIVNGQAEVPADLSGLYRIKLTPEAQPLETGGQSGYILQSIVEIRPANAKGTLSVWTPLNRAAFNQGEAIPFSVSARSKEKDAEVQATVRLVQGAQVVAELKAAPKSGAAALGFCLPPALTAGLKPGEYRLIASADGYASAPQPLVIGPAMRDPAFFNILHADMGYTYPLNIPFWNAADTAASYASRYEKLGLNLLVDRIGWWNAGNPFQWHPDSTQAIEALGKGLQADPVGVAPEKVSFSTPWLQMLGLYGAKGIRQMGIPTANDAGLPLGTGCDPRKPEETLGHMEFATRQAMPYPSFRGWAWAANWWVFNHRGSAAAKTPEEKAAFETAFKKAMETGAYDPVLDTVSNQRLGFAVEAQAMFNKKLKEIAPDKGYVTASAAPYRNVESYPPISFSNVDEADLQIQWEQMMVPYHWMHNVDFYKRPGKRAYNHPECWNDDGTGGQLMTVLLQSVMRGADGTGIIGGFPTWDNFVPDDPRVSHFGYASVFRSLSRFFRAYGPMLARTENDDRVAIAASGRMYKLDGWHHDFGFHMGRQFEAYITCLHAHQPASFVLAEDVKPDTFKRFKAILLVDERVELEPELMKALLEAKAAGAKVFYDKTCRAELFKEFTPLEASFDKLEKCDGEAGNDQVFWVFQDYARASLPAVIKALESAAKPVADIDDDAVLLTQRKAGKARYLWVANNTQPKIDPGQFLRMNLSLNARVPCVVPVKLAEPAPVIYDVMAMKQVKAEGGTLQCDLRSIPARLYAMVPTAIEQVEVKAPASIKAGQPFAWQASAQDAGGKAIDAAVPLRVRLVAADKSVLDEQHVGADAKGAAGSLTAPWNAAGPLSLEVTELFSGKTARAAVAVNAAPAPAPVALADAKAPLPKAAPAAPAPADKAASGKDAAPDVEPTDDFFGPHIRDLTLVGDGKLAVMSAMNYDNNLYAVDTESGKVKWRQRFGHYFAYLPQAIKGGFAVQGFDFKTAEGYHLYLADENGKPEGRIALYGLPKRYSGRFIPDGGPVMEEYDQKMRCRINNFAVPQDGSWVANAGDLGIGVWSRDGKVLWKRACPPDNRQPTFLAAADAKTLLALEGMKAVVYNAADGKKLAEIELAATGRPKKAFVCGDGKTVAVLTNTEGGRLFILRDRKLLKVLVVSGEDAALSADGSLIALAGGRQLALYSLDKGLLWTWAADDRVRCPRLSTDEKRIAVTTDLGGAAVLDLEGKVLWQSDLGQRAVAAWLPGGDLLLAGWMGKVLRVGADYKVKWQTVLRPEAADMRDKLLADDGAPTVRVSDWSTAEPKPLPITPNLLAEVRWAFEVRSPHPWAAPLVNDPKLLWDGKADAPPKPWITWRTLSGISEGGQELALFMDAFWTQTRVEAITFHEDPTQPGSWLRDARLEYWDTTQEKWVKACDILADGPVHTHKLPKPVEAARFRVVLPTYCIGNLRLGEVVLHGKQLGCSHPDAIAKKPVAVLFDEQDDFKSTFWCDRAFFNMKDAYSGGRSVEFNPRAQGGGDLFMVRSQAPYGHSVPNWNFEIVEKPKPGQYRWMQWAWKASSPAPKSMTFGIAGDQASAAFYAGPGTPERGVKLSEQVPMEWKVERVDLWKIYGKDGRVQSLSVTCPGGNMLMDQILLGASEKDLDAFGKGEAKPAPKPAAAK